ncbi:class I SAM-dependent methyltransferase [Polaribacter sp. HL-MS24]|uniref:class I SAM-dependent methyltransferase n=1 Tax=Polaribacter sp. HL-MS24 TaxID=3077735 RepID=UPI0029351BC6|nr:class I SAM-dependent methyltransferase [Polaribacter sp. HL-MS24]WOC40074.1 class I SAM-dependent methyltransferase [Polaribacter sp. HL-MS24]
MKTKDWFTEWFNTPYYHILYKNRNNSDAQLFMQNITRFLGLPKGAHVADLPCGKGRHSIFLNSLGYNVTGGDLSEKSISHAKQFENETLRFEVWDMRDPIDHQYDAIFNLFTSFGYFEDDQEDLKVLNSIKKGLKKDGFFVFDFLNATKLEATLVKEETKIVDDITFYIQREIKEGFIIKNISFTTNGADHSYTERVKFLDLPKMTSFFNKVGFQLVEIFGDYNLSTFEKNTSDRLILVAK